MDYSNLPINEPVPDLSRWHPIWQKTRDFVDGEEAVKARRERYLCKVRTDDGPEHYTRHLENTNLYPAAAKIAQGILGLIMRKPVQLNTTSERVRLLANTTLTANGLTLDELCEQIVRETLITNFTGLLVDHPDAASFNNLTAANADRLGYRPRIGLYVGESILEATQGMLGEDRAFVRVRLLEQDGKRVRELVINDAGFYEQRIHDADSEGKFTQPPRVTIPRRNGEPLTRMPFIIVSSADNGRPAPALLKHSVDLNLQHYRLSGILANMTWMTQAPIVTLIGFKREVDQNGVAVDPQWDFAPNSVIEIKDENVTIDYFVFKPEGAQLVRDQLDNIKTDLSTIGHSILAPEKAAPEAPETTMLRRVAENAMLASFTTNVSRKTKAALLEFAVWADENAGFLDFSLNTDFTPRGMTAQEVAALQSLWLSGAIQHETMLEALKDGEVLPPTLDAEVEAELANAEAASRSSLAE